MKYPTSLSAILWPSLNCQKLYSFPNILWDCPVSFDFRQTSTSPSQTHRWPTLRERTISCSKRTHHNYVRVISFPSQCYAYCSFVKAITVTFNGSRVNPQMSRCSARQTNEPVFSACSINGIAFTPTQPSAGKIVAQIIALPVLEVADVYTLLATSYEERKYYTSSYFWSISYPGVYTCVSPVHTQLADWSKI